MTSEHLSHCISRCMVAVCLISAPLYVNDLWHISQGNFWPVWCARKCVFMFLSWRKTFVHFPHLNWEQCLCFCRCSFNSDMQPNFRSQCSHVSIFLCLLCSDFAPRIVIPTEWMPVICWSHSDGGLTVCVRFVTPTDNNWRVYQQCQIEQYHTIDIVKFIKNSEACVSDLWA